MSECRVLCGDCLAVLPTLEAGSVDCVVTDPPAGIAFMGKEWDGGRGGRDRWTEWLAERLAASLALTQPGGYLLCWALPRTSHWTGRAIEDAGWIVRDRITHLFGQGFPKGKACLKPAAEDWWLAKAPGKLRALDVDACRVEGAVDGYANPGNGRVGSGGVYNTGWDGYDGPAERHPESARHHASGRYPANITHDGSEEVLEAFAAFGPTSTTGKRSERSRNATVTGTAWGADNHRSVEYANEPPGTAARFFYCCKASKADRGEGNDHPTVKNTALMRWLIRLVCPPGGTILDPFGGSGTTGIAALREGRSAILIEKEPAYIDIIHKRLAAERAECPLFAPLSESPTL